MWNYKEVLGSLSDLRMPTFNDQFKKEELISLRCLGKRVLKQ